MGEIFLFLFGMDEPRLVSTHMVIGVKLLKGDTTANINETQYLSKIGNL